MIFRRVISCRVIPTPRSRHYLYTLACGHAERRGASQTEPYTKTLRCHACEEGRAPIPRESARRPESFYEMVLRLHRRSD